MIRIDRVDYEATVQDQGRPGYGHLGVPHAGAMDLHALGLGNRIAGNDPSAAAIEYLIGGLQLTAEAPITVAITGAAGAIKVVGSSAERYRPIRLQAGQVLTIEAASYGLRGYVCVAGGIDVPAVLGSRSTDTLAGLGPAPLQPGSTLPVGRHRGEPNAPSDLVVDNISSSGVVHARYIPGPRSDFFTAAGQALIADAQWEVTSELDRAGVRLSGPRIEHAGEVQLPSEGMRLGAIQVPEAGQPIVFLANFPSTGGYPVIGVVLHDDIGKVAQARPGDVIRFQRQPVPKLDG